LKQILGRINRFKSHVGLADNHINTYIPLLVKRYKGEPVIDDSILWKETQNNNGKPLTLLERVAAGVHFQRSGGKAFDPSIYPSIDSSLWGMIWRRRFTSGFVMDLLAVLQPGDTFDSRQGEVASDIAD
jgi:hypothetical protein